MRLPPFYLLVELDSCNVFALFITFLRFMLSDFCCFCSLWYWEVNLMLSQRSGSHVCCYLVKNYPRCRIVCLDSLEYCSSLKNLASVKNAPNFTFVKVLSVTEKESTRVRVNERLRIQRQAVLSSGQRALLHVLYTNTHTVTIITMIHNNNNYSTNQQ